MVLVDQDMIEYAKSRTPERDRADEADWDYLEKVIASGKYAGETILVRDCSVVEHSTDRRLIEDKLTTTYKDRPPIIHVISGPDEPAEYLHWYALGSFRRSSKGANLAGSSSQDQAPKTCQTSG